MKEKTGDKRRTPCPGHEYAFITDNEYNEREIPLVVADWELF
jgi:hypothetical protein